MAYLIFFVLIVAGMLFVAGFLHLARGIFGDRFADALCAVPGLDVVVFALTVLPQLIGIGTGIARHSGISGTLGWLVLAVFAQGVAMVIWMRLHEWANPEAAAGPRIVKSLNRAVGPWRNTAAVWWTAWAVPLFAIVRVAELLVYPPITWLIGLPKYKHADWIRVSRQKHVGLVGNDLIWCLYCDWMTGVWSLGSEMLRNIESFWCPIRFSSEAKCENCKIDFPDVEERWSAPDGTMQDVTDTVEKYYPGPDGVNAWFGHPVRTQSVTVEGEAVDAPAEPESPDTSENQGENTG